MALFHLVLTCCLMFVGPIVCGLLPLLFAQMSSMEGGDGDSWTEPFAAGVMLGSAFAVVLPEGFEALYSAAEGGEHENHHRRALLMPEDGFQAPDQYELEHQHVHDQEGVPSSYAGLALLAGFLAMMVFEVWHHSYEHACAAGAPQGHGGHRHSHGAAGPGSREMPVLLGLIVHAAADGLAVGVASVSPSIKLAVGVGMAMVLHKGPVAFGLGTFLVSQKLPTYTVIKDIMLFASSSPIVAIFTYMALAQIPFFQSGAFVALAVLFSAGTFLYAACVHMLPRSLTARSLLALVAGAVMPCTINLFDVHHH